VATFHDDLADRLALGERLLRDAGRLLVAEVGVERRDDRRRSLRVLAQPVGVRGDTVDASVREEA
jgi:hypothetical protein